MVLSLKVLLSIKHNAMQASVISGLGFSMMSTHSGRNKEKSPQPEADCSPESTKEWSHQSWWDGSIWWGLGFGFVHYVIKPNTAGTQGVSLKSTVPLLTENNQEKRLRADARVQQISLCFHVSFILQKVNEILWLVFITATEQFSVILTAEIPWQSPLHQD